MAQKQENWIIPGDWIIRSVPTEEKYEDGYPMPGPRHHACEDHLFTDHAVFVLDITKSHMTIFEPLAGRPVILQLDRFEGAWHYATQRQVEVTWDIAAGTRERNQAFTLGDEKTRYPYRIRGAAGREMNYRILGEDKR